MARGSSPSSWDVERYGFRAIGIVLAIVIRALPTTAGTAGTDGAYSFP